MLVKKNVSMKPFSNMKVGGIAKELVYIDDENELLNFFKEGENYYLLGNGTNTLIHDGFIDITFVSLKKLNKIISLGDKRVYVEAGADLSDFIKYMRDNNLGGLENITGIPGTIGGLINMNGGAYGTTIFDKIKSVRVFSKEFGIRNFLKEDLSLRYRGTEIKDSKWIVLGAEFELDEGFDIEASEDKIQKRQNNHPLDYPNLGSTFKNPDGDFAARVISECNLKNYRIGDIQVSSKHPNFLINLGNAKFDDVMSLIKHIQKTVKDQMGIILETEIVIIENDSNIC